MPRAAEASLVKQDVNISTGVTCKVFKECKAPGRGEGRGFEKRAEGSSGSRGTGGTVRDQVRRRACTSCLLSKDALHVSRRTEGKGGGCLQQRISVGGDLH